MPSEEVFLKLERHEQRIEVIKTYDSAFAKEAFEAEEMDDEAKAVLGQSLIEDGVLDADALPFNDEDLWQGVEDGASRDLRRSGSRYPP